VIAFRLALRRIESGQRPELPLNDPYHIAFLRGGAAQAARIAVMSLIDRGLLEVTGIEIERRSEKSSGWPWCLGGPAFFHGRSLARTVALNADTYWLSA
jgi:uncharacterized protein (TIGR04222 family)